jgi:membrane-bound lytic murein transglycosylase D
MSRRIAAPLILLCAFAAAAQAPAPAGATASEVVPQALANAPLAPAGKRPGIELPGASSPATTAEASVPVAIGDLWHRIRLGFQLEDMQHPVVPKWEEFYATRPEMIRAFAERGSRYLFHIVEEIEARGLPTEIALLPIIESAFNPKAYSRARASGLWQFIPSTGRVYGLEQTFWVDNRRDIVAATRAALDYLQRLHGMFGSWELAFAAYNCGEGCVGRAIARNQKAGLATDFASLTLPNETMLYVPKLMAIKNLVSSPASYGIELTDVANEPYFARIAVPQMDVKLAAQFAEMSVSDFAALNPSFTKPVVRSDHGHILLPKDRVDTFHLNLARHKHPLVNWTQYGARKGESVAVIARRYGMSVAELRAHNGFREHKGKLVYATTLLIPRRGVVDAAAISVESEPAAVADTQARGRAVSIQHVVSAGDNLSFIAQRYGTTVAHLQTWNGLRGSALRIGQRLIVGYRPLVQAAVPAAPAARPSGGTAPVAARAPSGRRQTHYTVRQGDNLSVIAGRSGISVPILMKLNRLTVRSVLQPGMKLRLVAARAAPART